MRLIIFLLWCSVLAATVTRSPSDNGKTCSSRPCTYAVRCAAAMCTSAEAAELQAVLDEAHRGDTIRLEAGRTWERSGNHFVVTARPGTQGYLTITTIEEARLPNPGTRVTRAYTPLMPTLQTSTTNKAALALAGTDSPAEYVKIRGIRFTVSPTSTRATTFSRGPLLIGWSSPDDYNGFVLTTPEQLPDNIVVQHCVFEQDWIHQVGRMIRLHGRRVEIRDNFIEGGQTLGADAQGISGSNNKGPYIIENNYIDGTSENLMFGGSRPNFDGEVDTATIRFNYFPHIRERHQYVPWSAGLVVFKGRVIQPKSGSGYFMALSTGVTGVNEPSWPSGGGSQVTDNGIVWERVTGKWVVKNNFEIKSGKNMLIQHNVFDGMWLDGQETAINIKAENEDGYDRACDAGWPACYGARTTGIRFLNNIVRDWPQALKLVGGTMGAPAAVGDYEIRNNLFDQAGASWPGFRSMMILGTVTKSGEGLGYDDVVVENNTFITATPNAAAMSLSGRLGGKTRFRNNIIPKGSYGFKMSGVAEGRASIEASLCGGGPCTRLHWDKNVVAGANVGMYPEGTSNLCPNDASCPEDLDYNDASRGRLFRAYPKGQYTVREKHPAKRGGAGGPDIGADVSSLPEIRNLQVRPSATAVLFSYQVTGPISSIPCVIEVSAARDLSTIVPDLNPAIYTRPDHDRQEGSPVNGLSRTIAVGRNVPLTAGTTYWYRLQCGGDTRRGDFTTLPAAAPGTAALTLKRVPAMPSTRTVQVEFATGYNRTESKLTNASETPAQQCQAGGNCVVTLHAARGSIVYYRWVEREETGAIAAVSDVMTALAQ